MNTIIEKAKSIVKKLGENQILSTVAFLLSIVMLFTATTVSIAWFVDYLRSGNIGFNTGDLDDNILWIANVYHSDPTEDALLYSRYTPA